MESSSPRHLDTAGLLGQVFSVQRYSIHDGPGIRTTVFFKGCPLACSWCHNPESRDNAPEVWMVPGHCILCGSCVAVCPRQEHLDTALTEPPALDSAHCLRCGSCVEVCPAGARQMVGRSVTLSGLLAEILRDRPFFEQSGGGVTFSGGEPLAQYDFLIEILRASRDQSLHTAVDTCGYAPQQQLLSLVDTTDLFLYDLKLMDDRRHREQTGVSVQPILDNLVALDATGAEVWIRLPLVPGVNDDRTNLEAVGRFVADLAHTRRVHVLPFHSAGDDKQLRLGRKDRPPARATLSEAARQQARTWLSAFDLDVHLGG